MDLRFVKMHGCGNDYVFVDNFSREIYNPERLATRFCVRRFGIGADGFVMLGKSMVADAKMRMFNPDGSEAQMCGNAIRCAAKFLVERGYCQNLEITIETLDGIKEITAYATSNQVHSARVNMGMPRFAPEQIPANLPGDMIIDYPLEVGGRQWRITCVSVGNPHCVIFVDNIDDLDLEQIGPDFEHHEFFPERINTEFIRIIDRNKLQMRVWERGAGETLACGTGAAAAAVAAILNGHCDKNTDIQIELSGGTIVINFTDNGIFMTGGCFQVYEGIVIL